MFDRDAFEKEVTERLQSKSREQHVAFAVRSAMRVLPLLAVKKRFERQSEAFWFWKKEEKDRFLLGVLMSYNSSIGHALAVGGSVDTVFTSTFSVARAARAVRYACNADDAATFAAYAAAYAAYAAAYADVDPTAVIKEIQVDLSSIDGLSTSEFLQLPLWSNILPKEWQQWQDYFKTAALSLNAGFEAWLEWYDDRIQGNPVDVEILKQWNNIPEEIDSQGVIAINAYLKNLRTKTATQALNRVRAIFIGYGEAGKTSLIRALYGEPVMEGKEPMTAGIEIRDWLIPDTAIKAHFWDFGGQVMAHATHQFFLRSSCLYVLVMNARNEINSTEQAEYWLQHVKSFGGDAPVMIVGNKADQADIHLDMAYLKGKYPNIKGFYQISCTQATSGFKAKFTSFKEDFCQQLRQVGTHQMLFTKAQFAVLQALHPYQKQSAFLKKEDFIAICQQHGIGEDGPQNRTWLLEILDKLGVVIHFPQLPCLDDYILNPRWLTHGVYTVMYHRQARLTDTEVVAILRAQPIYDEDGKKLDYPGTKCRFIMDAMHEFKLAYPLKRNTLMIPELLPSDQPKTIPFNKTGALAFEFIFRGFLPRHILPELIVNRHEEVVGDIVWQRGVFLQHKSHRAQALVQVDYNDRVLSIVVQGLNAKEYLSLLNDEVLHILARLELGYQEWISLPLSACQTDWGKPEIEEKAHYRQILACAQKGQATYISESGLEYDLQQILWQVLPKQKREGVSATYIFNQSTFQQTPEFSVNDRKIKATNYTEGDVKEGGQVAGRDANNTTQTNSGTVYGSVIAAKTIENCLNNHLPDSKADEAVKVLLGQLLAQIQELNGKVPAAQASHLETMASRTETLVKETQNPSPDKQWYEMSLKGITEAAKAVGDIAKPIIATAQQLAPLLL